MAWLRYGFTKNGDVLVVSLAELRKFLAPRIAEFQPASAVNLMPGSRQVRHITFSALVPITAILAACPSTMHLSMGKELDIEFGGPPLLNAVDIAKSGNRTAAEVLAVLAKSKGACPPMTPDYAPMWEHCIIKDRMKWNAWAFAALDEAIRFSESSAA